MDYSDLSFAENDVLDRKKYAEKLTDIIYDPCLVSLGNSSLSICLNSSWGSGKSYFINMWKNYIVSERSETPFVVYYNAWENDDFEDAFYPLFIEFSTGTSKDQTIIETFRYNWKAIVKKLGVALAKDGIKKLIGKNMSEFVSNFIDEGADAILKDKPTDGFDVFHEYDKNRKEMKSFLSALVPANDKLIIFIDELDRCNPLFAIKTLEIIKHFLNIRNSTFVFSVDILQLSHSIKAVYGNDFDAIGYLHRYFDLFFTFPQFDYYQYLKHALISDYCTIYSEKESLQGIVRQIEHFSLSLREINTCCNHLIILGNYFNGIGTLKYPAKTIELFLYFLVLKQKYPLTYMLIMSGLFSVKPNPRSGFTYLEDFFIVDGIVSDVLKLIQEGNIYSTARLTKLQIDLPSTNISLRQYIESTLLVCDIPTLAFQNES